MGGKLRNFRGGGGGVRNFRGVEKSCGFHE